MDKPFLPLVISYIMGILVINNTHISIVYLLIGLIIGIIILIFSIVKGRKNLLNILLVFIFLGMTITSLKADSSLLEYEEIRMEYVGIVEEVLTSKEDINKYIIKVEGNVETGKIINERIRLNVIGGKTLSYGEKILFNGEIIAPLNNTNPMLFNHRHNLLSNNIYATMTIGDYSIETINGTVDLKYSIKESFHKEINRIFDKYLNEGNNNIIKSIILGDSSYMVEEELQEYRQLGLGHILAVSGLHIGIISSFILYILMRLTIPRKYSSIITIGIIIFYGFLIGFPHSMVRGIIMFSLIILTKLLYEHSNPINILSLSALIVLIINPFTLFSLGFILSYTAVLSLFLFTERIKSFCYPYRGYFVETFSAILAVNIGLLPVQAYYFNYISILGLIANLISIPLLSLALVLSISMYLLEYILSFLNIGLSVLLNLILNLEGNIKDMLYIFSSLIFTVASPTLYVIIAYYLGVALSLRLIKISLFNSHIKKTIVWFLSLMLIVNIINISLDDSMELHFIDVGQGDSLLVKTKNKNILVDTGGSLLGNYVGEQITLPYLQKLGITKLDGVIITHFHVDHVGALPTLIDNIKIENIYSSYIPEDNSTYEKIKDSKVNFRILSQGDRLRINDDITCEVLWPGGDIERLSENNKSLLLSLNYKEFNILLTGDIEREAELNLLARIPSNVHIMKIAHHGSNTSTTNEFLEIARPEYSIISVGRNNQFNHPNDEVIKRLEGINTRIYRTDEMGLIKVYLDKGLNIHPFIETNHRSLVELIYENRINLIFYLSYYIIGKRLIIIYKRTGDDIDELC